MAKVIKAAIVAVAVTFLVVTGIGAIAGTAWGAAAGITAIASAGTMYATAFLGTLIAGGIGMLTNKGISASAGNFGTKVTGLGGATPRQIIYGTTRVGGTFVKMDTRGTKNAILSTTIVVAGHPCDGFDEMYFGETKLTFSSATVNGETVYSVTNSKFLNSENDNAFGSNGLARFTFHDGSQTAVDGLAAANNGTIYPSTAKFLGCSYFYIELVYDPEKMPNIPKIWFVMRGKNIWDPRANSGNGAISTTDAQRQNPALQIRDYLTDTTYGLKALDSELNDGTAGGGFSSAANLCDTLVTLTVDGNGDPATTERRYTSSGISNFSASGSGLIEAISTACAGNLTYTNGKFNLFAGASQTAALTITDDKLLAPPRITTQSQSGELFNAVKSIYINKDDNYQASEIGQFTSSAFLAADTPSGEASANFKRVLELRYPFTTSETTAQRLQRISLNHQRQATTVDLITSLEFMKAQPNDWIYLTNERLGYTNKTFEIQNMSMTFLENDGQIFAATSLSLQEIDASVFGFVYSEYSTPQPNAAQAVIGEVSISPPTIGTPVQITNVEGQTAKINIKAVWTNAVDSAIQGTEIQFKKSTEADSLYVTATLAGIGRTTAEIANVTVGTTYNIRVRHFSFDNVYSVYSSVANIAIAQPDTITNPTNLAVTTDKPFNIELSWTNPSNTNMRAVDVHYDTTTSYAPSPSNLLGTYYGDIGKKKTVLLGRSHGLDYGTNYYFKIRAVNIYGSVVEDGSGNPVYVTSPAGKMVKATTADVENLNAIVITAGTIDADNITVNNLGANDATVSNLTLTAAADSSVRAGKSSFEDATTAGFFLGFTDPDVGSRVEGIYIGTATNGMRYDTAGGLVVSGNISATTGFIGGVKIDASTISVPIAPNTTGTYNNANTAFFIGSDGKFSLKDKLTWDGTTLTVNGGGTFSGALSAASGTFTGTLSAVDGTFTGSLSGGTISIGSGNNIFKADSNGIYLGNATFGSAPFRVTPAGALTADSATLTSATVTGTINATGGAFTGDVTTAGKFIAGTGTARTVIDGNANANYRIFAGADIGDEDNAVFQVTPSGSVFANNITIYDTDGNILIDQNGLGPAALAGLSLTSGASVNKVSGVLSGDGGEMTLTLDTTATVTITSKLAIYANNTGSLYYRGESATSGSTGQTAALANITNSIFNVVYRSKVDSGNYSIAATKPITFTSTDSTPSATEVYVQANYIAGSINKWYTSLMGAGGALEYIASTVSYGATAYIVTSHTFTNLAAGVHKFKVSSTVTGTGSPVTSGQSTSNRLYELSSSDINFIESASNTFSNGSPSVPSGGGTVSGNLVVTGDLTVQGTTTTIDTANLDVKDKNITLNYSTGDSSGNANGAGITIQDAVNSTTDATILWDATNDKFDFSHKVNAPSLQLGSDAQPTLSGDGSQLKIQTTGGYVAIGPDNSSWMHFTTDRNSFYFNKKITVNEGIVDSYDEDLQLRRAASTTARLRITAGTTISDQALSVTGVITATGITTSANLVDLFNNQNGVNELRLDNNRQDLSNVAVSKVSGRNGVETSNMTFYRGSGGSSGYIRFQTKPTNAASLTDQFQIGDNNTVGYGVDILAGGLRIGGQEVITSSRALTNIAGITTTSGSITSYGSIKAGQGGIYTNSVERITNAGNLTNIGTISSGVVTTTGIQLLADAASNANDASLYIRRTNNNDWGLFVKGTTTATDYGIKVDLNGTHSYAFRGMNNNAQYFRVGTDMLLHNAQIRGGSFNVGADEVIDSNKNLTNIGTISSGAITSSGILIADQLRAGDGTDGYFYSDIAGRTAFNNGDFYIQDGVNTYYNYATNQYHGNATGTTHSFRSNALTGTNWGVDTSGNISGLSYKVGTTPVIDASRNITAGTITSSGNVLNSSIVARYTDSANVSGRIKVKLPFATNSGKMIKFTVSILSAYQPQEYEVSGYLYSTINQWHAPKYNYQGEPTPDIKVGRDADGKAYVSIAVGSYVGVIVHSVVSGYTMTESDAYNQGWAIARTSDVSNSVTPVRYGLPELLIGTTTVINASREIENVPRIFFNAGLQAIDLNNSDSLIFDTPDGHSALLLSGGSYDTNYYSNETHYFRGTDVLDVFATIDTTGIKNLGDYKIGTTTVIDSSRNATFAKATLGSGTNYPLQVSSTQRYQIQIRNENNTVNSSYGWWLATDTNFNFALHADGSADKFTLTRDGNATFAGTISSGAITSTGKIEATQLDLVGTDNYIAYGSAGTAPSNGDYLRLRDVATGNDALQFYMDSSKLFSIDGQTGNAYHKGTISSGAITSTGNSTHGGYSSWTAGNGTGGIFMHYNSSNSYRGYFDWRTLQLGNNGANNILAGNTSAGGYFKFWVNATGISQSGGTSGINALTISAAGNSTFSGSIDSGAITAAGAITNTSGSITSYGSVKAGQGGIYTNNVERITNAGNLTNIGTISSGAITSTGVSSFGNGTTIGAVELDGSTIGNQEAGLTFQPNSAYRCIHPTSMTTTAHTSDISLGWSNNKWKDIYLAGFVKADSGYQVGTATVIDASRNLTNLGNIKTTADNSYLSMGVAGLGTSVGARYLSIEGNTDGSGEGSGRIFFTEHNSSTAAMDNYGMSLGYRGGDTSIVGASGNTWTGLTQIGNGQWGMWGHDGNATGALIMFGDRAATYVDFAGNYLNNVGYIKIGTTTVIDSSRNITAGTISSGAITSSGQINAGTNLVAGTSVYSNNGVYYGSTTLSLKNNTSGSFLSFAANTNATFAGTISSGAITSTGLISSASYISASNVSIVAGDNNGIGFWGGTTGGSGSYAIWMASSGSGGRVTGETTSDYNMYFKMTAGTNRGFVFKNGSTNVAGIDSAGNGRFIGSVTSSQFKGGELGNPQITRNGLTYYVDFNNKACVSGTSSTEVPIDLSPNNYLMSLYGGANFEYKDGIGCYYFDGSADRIEINNFVVADTSNSIEIWHYAVAQNGWETWWDSGTERPLLGTFSGSLRAYPNGTNFATINTGKWYHVVWAFASDTDLDVFVNGVRVAEAVNWGNVQRTGTFTAWLGGDTSSETTNGYIAIARAYDRQLTAADVLQNYNAEVGTFATVTPNLGLVQTGDSVTVPSLQVGSTTVIDSSKNLTSIGTITSSGKIKTTAGELEFSSHNHQITTGNAVNIKLKTGTTGASGLVLTDSGNNFKFQMYGDGTSYGFLDGEWNAWDIKKNKNGAMYFNGDNTYYIRPEDTSNLNTVQAQSYKIGTTEVINASRNVSGGTATFSGKVIMGGDGAIAQVANSVAADTSNTYTLAVGSQGSSKSILAARNINTAGGGYQINSVTVIDASRNLTSINQITSQGLTRTNNRISSAQDYPVGHYTPSDTVFEIDPTWSEAELASFFGGGNVTWTADSTAPAGYAIYINGGVNVGGVYGSGFPYIPVGTSDIFYMECYVKNAGSGQTHYMGSNEFNQSFSSLGGNPGSYGYWVMSNTNVGSSWTKVSAYITGFGNSVGQFETGTKYWTPMALFNYGAGSGTRACYISGWKVIKVNASGNRTFEGTISSGAITSSGNIFTTGSAIIVDPASGDAELLLQGAAGAQTLRLDQNSIRSTTNSPISFLANNQISFRLNTDRSVEVTNGDFKVGSTTVIDASRNLTNIGDISLDAGKQLKLTKVLVDDDFDAIRIAYTGSWSNFNDKIAGVHVVNADNDTTTMGRFGITYGTGGGSFVITDLYDGGFGASGDVFRVRGNGDVEITNNFKVGGTTVIDASRNISSANIHVPIANFITFYGNSNSDHSICSRNSSGATADDIRINSYGSVIVNLDSNSNNTGGADFIIGRHGNGTSGISTLVTISGEDGDITTTGNVTAFSDERLKENIQTLDGKKVLQMRGVSFTKDGEAGSGVIAQELEKIAPELVRDGEYKSVAYGNITGYLIEAVKEQQKEIDELKLLVKQLLEK
jgi:hypothetical protein